MTKTNVEEVTKSIFKLETLNKEIQLLFEKIFATKHFANRMELMNKVFEQGVRCLAEKYLSKNKTKEEKELSRVRHIIEDSHVNLTILERLVTSLYNIKLAELLGKKISSEEVSNGLYAELPIELKQMQDEMHSLRNNKMDGVNE